MTIMEELVDAALKVCENSRVAGQKSRSRGAVLLCSNGKTYTGCDVKLNGGEALGVSAERAAVLAAIADGANKFDVSYLITLLRS